MRIEAASTVGRSLEACQTVCAPKIRKDINNANDRVLASARLRRWRRFGDAAAPRCNRFGLRRTPLARSGDMIRSRTGARLAVVVIAAIVAMYALTGTTGAVVDVTPP